MARKTQLGWHPYTTLSNLEKEIIARAMELEDAHFCQRLPNEFLGRQRGDALPFRRLILAAMRARKWRERLEKAGI